LVDLFELYDDARCATWREWRRIGCPKRSSLKNWKGRDEKENPGKDGENK
jgi:hypothetical protein